MTEGGSERKKEVAVAEEKHNSRGEVLAEELPRARLDVGT